MKLNGAHIIIELLKREGIDTIAGIPGGANLPLYDALYESGIKHILARHEQGAGFIAQGIARSTGKPAVCFATSGPGATNLLTALADAKLDSVPVIAVTGQVPKSLLGTDAFQEVDTYGMSLPVVKHSYLVRSAAELLTVVPHAFSIARSMRQGPVLIDVPKDVQNEVLEFDTWPATSAERKLPAPDAKAIEAAIALINQAKQPFIYFGGGVVASGAHEELAALARAIAAPSASTLLGLGCLPNDFPHYLGMIGMHGSRAVNTVIEEADLLIALGVRFDDRATGNPKAFARKAKILHIDGDPAEINKILTATVAIHADVKAALLALLPHLKHQHGGEWLGSVDHVVRTQSLLANIPASHPRSIIAQLARDADRDVIMVTDVGQHQMWAAQSFPAHRPRSFLSSGGLGTMGFGLPTAIGAALACKKSRVLCLTGDGSILMNIQELATLHELNLDVTIVLLDNGHLGLVRQQQELFYNKQYSASRFDSRVDFTAIAAGFGIPCERIAQGEPIQAALKKAMTGSGPRFLSVEIGPDFNVLPMVPPGKANIESIAEN